MEKPTLLILAAGMGSRYGGLKQMDAVGPSGEIVMDYSIHDAIRAGFRRVVFVIRRDIEDAFRSVVAAKWEPRIPCAYVFQELSDLPAGFAVPEGRAKPWGTAHAIRAGRSAIDGPFAAINADDFYGAESFRALAGRLAAPVGENAHCMVAFRLGQTLSENGTVSRGVCLRDAAGRLAGIREYTKVARDADGVLRTRDTNANILRGVTRRTLLDVLRDEGMKVEERPFTPAEAAAAKEAFITGAGSLVLPVVAVDDTPIGNGAVGPVAMKLRRLYIERARATAV